MAKESCFQFCRIVSISWIEYDSYNMPQNHGTIENLKHEKVPVWLNTDHPTVREVTHKEIFANPDHLPTFSSPAIEINMHRIPGLSNRFIYSNDDFFLMRPICPVKF